LVAEDRQGSIIGVAAAVPADADPTGTLGEVGSLYVHPDHQNRGLGRRLVLQLAACLAKKGVRSLQVGVLNANVNAWRFYEALGAQRIGDRRFDEDGVLLPERVYAWPDIRSLLG
jgi:ribosomal protein S18 acetylase RimI-like enzyme